MLTFNRIGIDTFYTHSLILSCTLFACSSSAQVTRMQSGLTNDCVEVVIFASDTQQLASILFDLLREKKKKKEKMCNVSLGHSGNANMDGFLSQRIFYNSTFNTLLHTYNHIHQLTSGECYTLAIRAGKQVVGSSLESNIHEQIQRK